MRQDVRQAGRPSPITFSVPFEKEKKNKENPAKIKKIGPFLLYLP